MDPKLMLMSPLFFYGINPALHLLKLLTLLLFHLRILGAGHLLLHSVHKMIIIVRINLPSMKRSCFKDKEKKIPVKGVAGSSPLRNVLPLHLEVPLPQQIDGRIDEEFQEE